MTNYYIEENGKIVNINADKQLLINTYGKDVEIQETERPLALSDDGTEFVFADTDEYEQEQAKKRTQEFYNNFVVTSWGAFRKTPKGYSSAVEAVNTIFNMVNVAKGLTETLSPLLIFYEVPDFTDPEQ